VKSAKRTMSNFDFKEIILKPVVPPLLAVLLLTMLLSGFLQDALQNGWQTMTDLLSVEVQGSCAIVNFSENFENYYPEDAVRERLMIYSIVNTLTQDPTIHQVQILVEERRVGAIGSIDLTNPLIRNPGLISIE